MLPADTGVAGYPAPAMAAAMAAGVDAPGSNRTLARPLARSMSTECTPGSWLAAARTRVAHARQVIPETLKTVEAGEVLVDMEHSLCQATRNTRSRRLLVTTLTELTAMAALARIGLSSRPKAG